MALSAASIDQSTLSVNAISSIALQRFDGTSWVDVETKTGLATGLTNFSSAPDVFASKWRFLARADLATNASWGVREVGFTAIPNNSPTINLTYPTNNQTIKQGTDVNFQWAGSDADGDALTYTLQVGTSSGASNIYNASVGSATSKKGISTAWAVGMYYWRVIADDGKGGVTTSAEGVFGLAKGNLVAISPANSAVKDTRINSTNTTTNYGTENTIAIQGGSTIDRALQFFDLGLIPNDAIINSAVLKLNKESGLASSVNLHKVITEWVDTGATWAIAPSYDATPVTSLAFTATNGLHQFDVKSLVQNLVNGDKNCGMLFKLPNEATSVNILLSSANTPSIANRPVLEIDYSIPTTGKKQVEVVAGANLSGVSATTYSPEIPASAQPGDLVAFLLTSGSNTTVTAPAGWTKQYEVISGSNTESLFTKKINAGEASPTFTSSTTRVWASTSVVFRNVKSVLATNRQAFTSGVSFNPTFSTVNVSASNSLFVLFNTATSGVTFTPPSSYNELQDAAAGGWQHEVAYRYMHGNLVQTSSEMTSMASTSTNGFSGLLVLEPYTNTPPTVTLTSPANNQTLTDNSTYAVQGTATDVDSGNVVTVKYKINNGPTRALQSGVSNGSTPISFAKNLMFKSKRMWDGAVDVAGSDLAENVNHTLEVWAEDDQGAKSTVVTRTFKVIWNRPPVISGENSDLGLLMEIPAIQYSAIDPEGNTFKFSEYLNGKLLRTFDGEAGQNYTVNISHDAWIRLNLDVQHQVKIVATDSMGLASERIYTFTRTETHIEFTLNFDNPSVQGHFILDGMPERVLVSLERYIPEGASIESVKVCNNALDASPTWEDATNAVKGGRGYLFTNTTKTAANWAINLWVVLAKGTATERVRLNGYGGAFD